MLQPLRIWTAGRELGPREASWQLLDARAGRRVEVEIGFGKGRFLLARAAAAPESQFLGLESAPVYWSLGTRRAERRALRNVTTICGDALYVLAAWLPQAFADAVHVYFPDPWPKLRHRKRRLLDESTVDLVVGALAPGGTLCFATDHAEYGAAVSDVLARHPRLAVERIAGPWPDGARTNYETKYQREGRPILRLQVTRRAGAGESMLHPDAGAEVVAGVLDRER